MPDLRLPLDPNGGTIWDDPNWVYAGSSTWYKGWPSYGYFQFDVVDGPNFSSGKTGRAVYTLRVHISQLKMALANIRGWGEWDTLNNCFDRVLPIRDPDGFGMLADEILDVSYIGKSGYKVDTVERSRFFQDITDGAIPAQGADDPLWLAVRNMYADIKVAFVHYPFTVNPNDAVQTSALGERIRYMFGREDVASEYLSLDRGVIYWNDPNCPAYINADKEGNNANTPKPIVGGAPLFRSLSEIKITWYRVPFDGLNALKPAWRYLLDSTNESELELPVFSSMETFAAESLLFRPWKITERMSPHGFLEFDVELHWTFRNTLWNFFLYPNGTYYRVGWNTTIPPAAPVLIDVYPKKDHTIAFNGMVPP